MANYYATVRTNYFRVINEEKYQKIFSKLSGEDTIHDFTKEENGVIYHGFGSYGCVEYLNEDEDYDFDAFLKEIQDLLPNNEAFMYFEIGYEKLRYVNGTCYLVTRREIKSMSLDSWAANEAKNLIGDSYTTQMTY